MIVIYIRRSQRRDLNNKSNLKQKCSWKFALFIQYPEYRYTCTIRTIRRVQFEIRNHLKESFERKNNNSIVPFVHLIHISWSPSLLYYNCLCNGSLHTVYWKFCSTLLFQKQVYINPSSNTSFSHNTALIQTKYSSLLLLAQVISIQCFRQYGSRFVISSENISGRSWRLFPPDLPVSQVQALSLSLSLRRTSIFSVNVKQKCAFFLANRTVLEIIRYQCRKDLSGAVYVTSFQKTVFVVFSLKHTVLFRGSKQNTVRTAF